MAPSLRDAHADFRKGQWKKPALFGAIAVAAGLSFAFLPPAPQKLPAARAPAEEPEGPVIGSSVSPAVIADPDADRFKKLGKKSVDSQVGEEESEAAPARSSNGSANLAEAFKQAAR